MGGQRIHGPQLGPFDPQTYQNATQTHFSLGAQDTVQREERRRARRGERPLSHSERGRIAMEMDAGVSDSRWDGSFQLHHIGETGNEVFQSICGELGLDSDAPFNTVYLPEQETDETEEATVHRGSHVQDYKDSVNEALMWGIDQVPDGLPPRIRRGRVEQAVVDTVGKIRRVILTNQLPLNARNDAMWSEDTEDRITVREIFEREGLLRPPE